MRDADGTCAPREAVARRAQARLPASRRDAGEICGARVRSFLSAADGRRLSGGEYASRHRLLSASSSVATEPPDTQEGRHSLARLLRLRIGRADAGCGFGEAI